MKKTLIAFTVSIYVFLLFAILSIKFKYMIVVAGAALGATLITWIVNIVTAIKTYRSGTDIDMRMIIVYKFIQIPFFVCNFILWTLLGLAMMFNPIIIIFIMIIPVVIISTFCIMMSTSIYTILYLRRNSKEQLIKHSRLHAFLQLMFVCDVIDCFLLRKQIM
ncbi:MAG: hypothetical protein J6N52_05110 [Clostridia bacterium]|nr:hypothetical protein [Clostridia bacterium]